MNKLLLLFCIIGCVFAQKLFPLSFNHIDHPAGHFGSESQLIALADAPFTPTVPGLFCFSSGISVYGSTALVSQDAPGPFTSSDPDKHVSPTRRGKILFAVAMLLGTAMIVIDRFLRRSSQ